MSGAAHPSIGIGFRVGKLTVQAPTEQRKNGYTVWECRCDCGGSIRLDTRALRRYRVALPVRLRQYLSGGQHTAHQGL